MNNNGVINKENNTSQNSQPILAPMAGVRIAPVTENQIKTSPSQQVAVVQPQGMPPQNNQQVVATTPQNQKVTPSNIIINQPPEPPIAPPNANNLNNNTLPTKKSKKSSGLTSFLLLIIIGLGAYIYYSSKNYTNIIKRIQYECSPVSISKKEKNIDMNSTLIKDLYSKVSTNIREDLAQPLFNDQMKLYLAYRQILDKDKYDSNCNLFSSTSMEPYICDSSANFFPKAFKEETLRQEIKKLFGEDTDIPLQNIQLGNSCIIGYQYIADRGEFVQGYCNQQNAISYKVTKTLKEAKRIGTTIILTEDVKYHESEKMPLPEYLKSGTYKYTFRLDMNYNYIFVNKIYEEKY